MLVCAVALAFGAVALLATAGSSLLSGSPATADTPEETHACTLTDNPGNWFGGRYCGHPVADGRCPG
jgi:hypothetical protein